jgi:hypothetical protein
MRTLDASLRLVTLEPTCRVKANVGAGGARKAPAKALPARKYRAVVAIETGGFEGLLRCDRRVSRRDGAAAKAMTTEKDGSGLRDGIDAC